MSTRIYNGFRFASGDIADITAALKPLESKIEKLQRHRYVRTYAEMLVSVVDRSREAARSRRTKGMVSARPDRLVRDDIRKRQARIRATQERDVSVDLEVVLTCWHSRLLGEVIGFVGGEMTTDVHKLLLRAGVAVDFAYWDTSDADENVCTEEWTQRKKVWHQVISKKSGAGFQFRFDESRADLMPVSWKELEPHLPSADRRAKDVARTKLFSRWYRQLSEIERNDGNLWAQLQEFESLCKNDSRMKAKFGKEVSRIHAGLLIGDELDQARMQSQLLLPLTRD